MPLSHSPAPWGFYQGRTGWIEHFDGTLEIEIAHIGFTIKNKADEALILKAPDLYHTLKDLVHVVRFQVDGDVMDNAQNLLAEIERMAHNNG